jgi:predicted phosphodiesterase
LLSDTHSHIDDTILKYVAQADEVWHAGDIGDLTVTDTLKKLKPLRAVYGNIDDAKARLEFPYNRFMCEGWMYGLRILVVIQEIQSCYKRDGCKSQIIYCGHSHILKVMFDKKHNLLHMNPGLAEKVVSSGTHHAALCNRGDKIKDLRLLKLKSGLAMQDVK